MNITFLIGNGFDVNLGLKTLYTDFYPSYIKSNENRSSSDPIRQFCDKLIRDREVYEEYIQNIDSTSKKPEFIEEWKDFEFFFAKNANGSKDDIARIIADFNNKFADYLKNEDSLCKYDSKGVLSDFNSFVVEPYASLALRHKQDIQSFYQSHEAENHVYTFVNFNYTSTVTNLVKKLKSVFPSSMTVNNRSYTNSIPSVLDIHGSINGDYIIIGIDSLEQFQNENLRNNTKVGRHCVKRIINEEVGYGEKEKRFVDIINNSNIIYTFGLSFGLTDASRWKIISEWLKKTESHKLVVFKYKSGFDEVDGMSKGLLYDAIDTARDEYLNILGVCEDGEYEKYHNRIYVADSNKVLNFKLIEHHDETIVMPELVMP